MKIGLTFGNIIITAEHVMVMFLSKHEKKEHEKWTTANFLDTQPRRTNQTKKAAKNDTKMNESLSYW